MARRFAASRSMVLIGMVLAAVPCAVGQQRVPAQGPRFLLAAWTPGHASDASGAPVLQTKVTLDLRNATIDQALKEIIRQTDLEISYSSRIVPLERRVSVRGRDITVAAALGEVLAGLPVDVSLTEAGGLALVRGQQVAVAPTDTGTVSGQVTDSAMGAPIAGATVIVEGTRQSAVTDAGGKYRIGGLPAGSYMVRARYIGYRPSSASVMVGAGEGATADFVLPKSTQELEQVVVTGTIVPTEVKALPTPVTVISESDIAIQRPLSVQDLFRKAVPGAVGWSYTSAPYQTSVSVRGGSSMSTTASSMKIFLDGVDAAEAGYSQVDPTSIARMEVIRGPQAAAIYGSEAIGGVIQIFTKRGGGSGRPQVSAEVGMGVVQTPYSGYGGTLRQDYKASVRGGGSGMGYNLGVGYSHLGDWLPDGEISRQSNPSIYAGVNFYRGPVEIDISGRYYTQYGGNNLSNPALLQTGYVPYSKPSYQPMQTQNQTVGARLTFSPQSWWHSTLSVGFDRFSYDLEQTRPRLTTPEDTLFLVANQVDTKSSIGLSTSMEFTLGGGFSGSLTGGVDHWSRPVSSWYALDATKTTGTIETGPSGSISASRTETRNSGFFTQVQLGYLDAVFLTAGLRAEANTDFGDSLGTPLLPRVGFAFVQAAGRATVKLRGSWGRAILPPGPGRKSGFVSATSVQIANPTLGPERQQGWDAGLDATWGSRGSLSVTYYHQAATNLADAVVLFVDPVFTQQYQNVGRVKNTGVEVEGRVAVGSVTLQGQYAYTRSRIEQLSPTYAGDQEVGDAPLLRPTHTAGLSAAVAPFAHTIISTGLVYVGNWTNYDYLALFRCFGGNGPCQSTLRGYQVTYPEVVKLNLTMSQRFSPVLSGFLAIDNLTNNNAYEATNIAPVKGRTTAAGLQFQY